jgi:hypothetical protein
LALLVEPIGEEADAELALDLEILEVRCCGACSRQTRELVAIHEERHEPKDAATSWR